jgi:GntR family transcriptional repressor for pyruvate dehydrogenase complex
MADILTLHEIKKTRVSEDIVTQLKGLIAQGKLHSGDQLPSERDLSEQFKVSRASVREAIRALESIGLLEARQGHGTYVATSVEALVQPLAHAIAREENALLDLFEVRRLLEPQLAALAAERAGPQELEELEGILERQAQHVAAGETGADLDTAFHSALARAARNTLLLRLNDTLVECLRDSRRRSLDTPERPRRSLAGHQAILRALRARDAKAAQRAMLKHLEEIEHNVLHAAGGAEASAEPASAAAVPDAPAARLHAGGGPQAPAARPASAAGPTPTASRGGK